MEVLMHHADARGQRVGRAADRHRTALDPDLAGIGTVDAEQDVHQRRLAGAVLAEQPQNLAMTYDEVDRPIGVHRAKALVDAAQLEQRCGCRHGCRGEKRRAAGQLISCRLRAGDPRTSYSDCGVPSSTGTRKLPSMISFVRSATMALTSSGSLASQT